ncbi:MAG: hypothetical protein ABSG89_01500 [Bacteroidales bacterium]
MLLKPALVLLMLFLPTAWGLAMSFSSDIYHVIQGFFYISVPVILILTGFQLSGLFSRKQFLSFIVFAGNLTAVVFITLILLKAGPVAFISPYKEARLVVGPGSPACVLSLVISAYSKHFGIQVLNGNGKRYGSIFLNLIAIYLFASRTYWVMLFMFIIIFSINIMKKDLLLFYGFLILGIVLLTITLVRSTKALSFTNSIIYKLVNSFEEIKISKFKNFTEVTTFYRGYEAYRSWITFAGGNILEKMFGGGLGKMVNLNARVLLDGAYWTSVPWVHNGFFFCLVKTGALGLFSILSFFIYIFREGFRRLSRGLPEIHFLKLLLIGCAGSLFIATFVICGIYNLEIAVLIITIGFLLQVLE